jgi:hypothetical protein
LATGVYDNIFSVSSAVLAEGEHIYRVAYSAIYPGYLNTKAFKNRRKSLLNLDCVKI